MKGPLCILTIELISRDWDHLQGGKAGKREGQRAKRGDVIVQEIAMGRGLQGGHYWERGTGRWVQTGHVNSVFPLPSSGHQATGKGSGVTCSGLHPASTTHWLCDLEQVTQPLCASVSAPVKWNDNSTQLTGFL